MDTRFTPEQAELQRSARQLARELGPATVADLDDATRTKRLAAAVHDAGWPELRDDSGDGSPLASGVEAVIVADALGGAVADVAFIGPVLAGDLARRAGITRGDAVAAFDATLTGSAPVYAVDCGNASDALSVVPEGVARVRIDGAAESADLTRSIRRVASDADVLGTPIGHDDVAQWTALGLALTSADLVGVMRGVLGLTVAYAAQREQYGVPVGSFQAVQHLLAEAHTLMEGSLSCSLHASWAVDNLAPADAVSAGRVAKAYCARAARTVCETSIQVHGGIGNTWECMAHVYLRRALLSTQWFGDDGAQLQHLSRERLGANDGLS